MSRLCPACEVDTPLREIRFHDQDVDLCDTCSGIFFDAGELEAIFSLVEMFTSVQIDEEEIEHVPTDERLKVRLCPHDNQSVMDDKNIGGVWLDLCPSCKGIWVDGGEIAALKLAEKQIKENLTLYIRLGD